MNINPLKIVQELKDDGFTEDQAKLILKQLMAAIQESDLVNKDFLENKLAVLKADLIAEGARRFTHLEITTVNRMSESEKKTAGQIAQLEAKIADSETQMTSKITDLKTEMIRKFAESETQMIGKFAESEKRVMSHITALREDMYKLEIRLITWMVSAQLATIILILGIFYFFFSQVLIKILPK